MTENTVTGPLHGIRVLDFSKVLAGPLCTQYLADMGADVIKVEPLGVGDDTRAWPPFAEPGIGAVYLSSNRGKRSIGINLKTEAGQALALQLATTCDVAIESFGTGVAERLKIDEATLRSARGDLVYCSISGFGRVGPMKQAPGYDVILQAFCGVMALTGEEGGGYMRSPISPIDQMTGMHALAGILAALHDRQRSGVGRRVDVNLFDTALGLMGYNLESYWLKGHAPSRCGSSHESLCPYQAFSAADGPIMIGVANDSLWRRFCQVAGLSDIVDDPRFATNPARVSNRADTVSRVQAVISTKPVEWWMRELAQIQVPAAPINDIEQLLGTQQAQSSEMIIASDAGDGVTWKGIAHPVRFDGRRNRSALPPPRLGEHGSAILSDLGLGTSDINKLVDAGAIAAV